MNQEDIDREVLQYQILQAIFAKAIRGELLLKGGFALRMVAGSPRRTKDVDLQQDPRRTPLRRLQKLMRSAIAGDALRDSFVLDGHGAQADRDGRALEDQRKNPCGLADSPDRRGFPARTAGPPLLGRRPLPRRLCRCPAPS